MTCDVHRCVFWVILGHFDFDISDHGIRPGHFLTSIYVKNPFMSDFCRTLSNPVLRQMKWISDKTLGGSKCPQLGQNQVKSPEHVTLYTLIYQSPKLG